MCCRFHGKGLVLAFTLGRKYFTCAYINIRIIRDIHKCTLPIEVFYASDDPVPPEVIRLVEASFDNVKFLNIYEANGIPKGLSMNGYRIKVFALLLSSFEEVLLIDSDNMPTEDPSFLFNIAEYKSTGAVFWPDFCMTHSSKMETWLIFGLPFPAAWPESTISLTFTKTCDPNEPGEISAGEIVMHKKKAWRGLIMTAFINRNSLFATTFIYGDKQTFPFSFNSTGTPFAVINHPPVGVGRAATLANGDTYFCSNTVAQRHPRTGEPLFLHRNSAKFVGALEYLDVQPFPRAWTHVGRQGKYQVWESITREKLPTADLMIPVLRSQSECFHPSGAGNDVVVVPASSKVYSHTILI